MAAVEADLERRLQIALRALARFGPVAGAYLFGSRATGVPNQWSDIDLAVFVDGVERWNFHQRARVIAAVQKDAGDDIELHLFPARTLEAPPPASFAAWVVRNGVPIALPASA